MSAEATILRWREGGPALFAVEALGVPAEWDATTRRGVTPQQWAASKALAERRRVSIRSGHGTGKSSFLSWAILWFLSCFFPSKIPATAPTGHQLSDILWAELAKWYRVLCERVPDLGAEFEWRSEVFHLKSAPRESFAVARTSRPENPDALQGFHSENLLFLIDEASGIPDQIFEVAEGALSTEGAYAIMAGNPTRMSGYFYESHHKARQQWACLHWNGEDSPLVSQQHIEDMRRKYGEDSAIYKIRVKGEFAGTLDGVIPLDIVTAAVGRDVKPFGDTVWGLDVARFGDDRTALCKRQSNSMDAPVIAWSGLDTMQTAGRVMMEYEGAKVKPSKIFVDVIGIGAGVVDRLRELKAPVVGVNVAEAPSADAKYARLRDELWFKARDWFQARDCRIADDEDLIAELTLPTYSIQSNGKLKVEAKDEIKKRGVVSPDLADAFCLTFARGGAFRDAPIKYDNRGIV